MMRCILAAVGGRKYGRSALKQVRRSRSWGSMCRVLYRLLGQLPGLRAHRGEPLSRDHPQIPVSMPSLFRFDASAVVHTCSSSHRTPAPLTARPSTATLTTPALDRRSLRWFGISACTVTPQDLPPSLAQHGSCRRSSTSSSLPFRTHVGAGNSAVVVDLPRCGPMLSPRVSSLVPIPGPRMERETPGQRPRPNYGHPHPPGLP